MNRDALAEHIAERVSRQPGLHWLRSCHVFLFAYRPSWFSRPRGDALREFGGDWWGPAYSYRFIRKRGVSGRSQPSARGRRESTVDEPTHWRRLSVPNRALAAIQRELLEIITPAVEATMPVGGFPLEVHGVKGRDRGPMLNAWAHVGASRLLRLDIENFFGTVRRSRIVEMLGRLGLSITSGEPDVIDASAIGMMARLCTHAGVLPQGACTSPILANIYFDRVDRELISFARDHGLTYTRYFDDLCFSTTSPAYSAPDRLHAFVLGRVVEALQGTGLRVNPRKSKEGSGREFAITGFEVHRNRLRLSKRGRAWIRRLAEAGRSDTDDALSAAVRLWRDERSAGPSPISLTEIRSLVDRWFDVLDRLEIRLDLAGGPEGQSDGGSVEAKELAADLLAALESNRGDVSEPEVHRGGVISWRLDEDDGARRRVAVRDEGGRLAAIVLSDRAVCTAANMAGFLDHMQGLKAMSVLERDDGRIGAVQDADAIDDLIQGLLRGEPRHDASEWSPSSSDVIVTERSIRLEELGRLDQTLRRAADLRGIAFSRMPRRELVEGGEDLGEWVSHVAGCLRRLQCDRPVGAAWTDGDSLWRSSSILAIRMADWCRRQRQGLYDWEQLRDQIRKGMRPRDLENVGKISVEHATFWQRRLCRNVCDEVQCWIDYWTEHRSYATESSFEHRALAGRLVVETERRVRGEVLESMVDIERWHQDDLPRLETHRTADPWRSILDLSLVIARGIIESRGSLRMASIPILEERLHGSPGEGRASDVEKMIFRRSLQSGAGRERVEIGTIIWHLRHLNSHGAPSRDADEREQTWKQVNRLMRMIGRVHPEDWTASRASGSQLRESFQLQPIERMEIIRVMLGGVTEALLEFDLDEYEDAIRNWSPSPRRRRSGASGRRRRVSHGQGRT